MSERILGFLISPSQVSRRVAALGVVALAASLAACGGSSDNASSNAGATATLAVLDKQLGWVEPLTPQEQGLNLAA